MEAIAPGRAAGEDPHLIIRFGRRARAPRARASLPSGDKVQLKLELEIELSW
jgi:hypothetical protein